MTDTNLPEILTFADVCELLRLSKPAVLRAIKGEGLPARKIGQQWRFIRSEVMAWMRERAA